MLPPNCAVLPTKVLLVTLSVPRLSMPPPSTAKLPETVQLVTASVPSFRTPPPKGNPLAATPLAMVRFRRLTVAP
jgi:hypothetical protein